MPQDVADLFVISKPNLHFARNHFSFTKLELREFAVRVFSEAPVAVVGMFKYHIAPYRK